MTGRFSFAFKPQPAPQETPAPIELQSPPVVAERAHEPTAQRPALLDEKVDLHGKIVDEFNLASLDKMSREELTRQISDYVSDYIHGKCPLENKLIPLNHL